MYSREVIGNYYKNGARTNMEEEFKVLKDKVCLDIYGGIGDSEMVFEMDDDSVYSLYHNQECCESVEIIDIVGDISDIIGSPILLAEEVIHEKRNPEGVQIPEDQDDEESFTWTFYKLVTIKGSITIRWYGGSNGYYSETADFKKENRYYLQKYLDEYNS